MIGHGLCSFLNMAPDKAWHTQLLGSSEHSADTVHMRQIPFPIQKTKYPRNKIKAHIFTQDHLESVHHQGLEIDSIQGKQFIRAIQHLGGHSTSSIFLKTRDYCIRSMAKFSDGIPGSTIIGHLYFG